MRIAVVSKKDDQKARGIISGIKKYLEQEGHELRDERKVKGSDYIVTLGGDGTLIHKACEYVELGIPIIGINTGSLGFLTAVDAHDWRLAVDRVLAGKTFISERISLDIKIGKDNFRAVNEAVVKGLYRVVELRVGVREVEFLKVLGDGVIIASQTGSTAYSLSSGGPIVDPDLDCMLVTPINPIGLPIPSVMLSPDELVKIEIVRGDNVLLIVDGQEHRKVSTGDRIEIKRGKYRVKLGYLSDKQFLKALNMKFGLGSRAIS